MFVSKAVDRQYSPTLRFMFRMQREFSWDWFSQQGKNFQERCLTKAEELKPLVDQNAMLAWIPHSKQRDLLGAKERTRAFIGGNRSGKTTAGIADLLIQACDADSLPPDLLQYKRWDPPFHCRIVTPDLQRTSEGVVMEKLREMCPRVQLKGGSWVDGYEKAKRTLRFENGSWVDMSLSYETDLDKFGGQALHAVYYDEEPSGPNAEAIRSECRTRLIDYDGDEVFMMTPLLGMSLIYDTVWVPVEDHEVRPGVYSNGRICVVQVDMDENPHLSPEGKASALAGYTKEERAARKSGQFIHFSGLVYDEFGDHHIVDPIEPDHLKGQTVFVGIDPGISTTAVVLASFDRDNHMLIFDELYLGEQSAIPENVARVIKQKERDWKIQPAYYLIDPSARNRQLTDADRVQAAYFRAGISTVPAQNDLEAGVFEVKRRLQHNQLLVTRNCQRWLWERKRYRINPREDGKFAVITRQNHLMDACLVAGTRVATEHGEKPIEDIRVGERVWTRDGLRPVKYAGMTNSDTEIWEVRLSDGRTIQGTGNHPFWTDTKGWVRADTIRYGDILSSCQLKPLSSTASASSVIRSRPGERSDAISIMGAACYTGQSGKRPMGLFQRAITFITSMATRSIMRWKTWLASVQRIMFRSIFPSAPCTLGFANNAGSPSTPVVMAQSGFAQTTASQPIGGPPAWMTKIANALCVEKSSESTNTAALRLVPVHALGSTKVGRSAVYDLTVDGPPEFFANGVLVHNTRYVAMSRPTAGQIVKTTHRGVRGWVHGTAPPWRETPSDQINPLGVGF